ncbi:MAG: hypothetical protein GY943_27245, partial [Chloroflexi bacterium]|nr:hypothetical protein [Chloroflexota bacterium]
VGISSIAAERHQVFVAGSGTNAAGNRDWVVQALHARDGELLWQDQFDLAGGSDGAGGIDVAQGRIFVNGSGTNASGNSDWILRVYQVR